MTRWVAPLGAVRFMRYVTSPDGRSWTREAHHPLAIRSVRENMIDQEGGAILHAAGRAGRARRATCTRRQPGDHRRIRRSGLEGSHVGSRRPGMRGARAPRCKSGECSGSRSTSASSPACARDQPAPAQGRRRAGAHRRAQGPPGGALGRVGSHGRGALVARRRPRFYRLACSSSQATSQVIGAFQLMVISFVDHDSMWSTKHFAGLQPLRPAAWA
jgi:hypothetical protein